LGWDWFARHREASTAIAASTGAVLWGWTAWRNPTQERRRGRPRPDANGPDRASQTFSKAVEQLARDRLDIRLGGIYTLELISRQSRHDYGVVMDVLSAFVRHRARWPRQAASEPAARFPQDGAEGKPPRAKPSADIAAVVAIIIRRETTGTECQDSRIDLRKSDLRGAPLANAPLRKANLSGANLQHANLGGANLYKANLSRANIVGANLQRANLSGGDFRAADMRNADLGQANISWSDLGDVILRGADLRGANLSNSRLQGADLRGADLRMADISRADISAAWLGGANLSVAGL